MNADDENEANKLAEEHWRWLRRLLESLKVESVNLDSTGLLYREAMVHGYKHARDES